MKTTKFYRVSEENQKMMRAAGRDAANRAMRKAGRTKWSRADCNLACAEFNRLVPVLGIPA